MILLEVTYGRGYVYSIQYHMVWCVKYRHKVLTSKIEKRLYEILHKIAEDNSFQMQSYKGNYLENQKVVLIGRKQE